MSERWRTVVLHACLWLPLASGVAWCVAGHWAVGAIGIAVGLVNARMHARRLRLRWPTFGNPNKRRPLVIDSVRWPDGR